MNLPSNTFEKTTRKLDTWKFGDRHIKGTFYEAIERGVEFSAGKIYPDAIPMAGAMICVNIWHNRFTGEVFYETVVLKDHPILDEFKKIRHLPRSVKSFYRKEVRLKHLRSGEAFEVMSDMDRAQNAFDTFIMNAPPEEAELCRTIVNKHIEIEKAQSNRAANSSAVAL